MTNYSSTSEITQAELDNLLTQLQQLRSSITTARETIAPLETNLAAAYNEFQAVVGTLRRQSMRLQAEIASLRSQIQRFTEDEDGAIITSQDQETVWVASWSSGLHSLKQQNELQTAPNISEPILTLTAGSDRYWAIGLDGLYEYKDSAWLQVISNKELVRGWLQAITQVVTDHVWLGTSAGLLLHKTDTKRLTPITGNLGSADVRSL